MDIPSLVLIVTGVANSFFGVVIYIKNRKDIINILYALLTLNLTIWALSIYFFRLGPDINLFWSKIAYLSAGTTAFLFLYFTLYFPFKIKLNLFLHIFLIIYFLILGWLIVGTKSILKEFTIVNHTYGLLFGKGYILYISFIFLFFGLGFLNLIRKYLQSKGSTKIQVGYILIGGLITTFTGTLTNLILFGAGIFKYNWMGPSSAISLVILFAYAITRYHLFGIRVILTETLVAAIGLTLLVQALTAETLGWKIFGFVLLAAFAIMGYLLINYTYLEIRRREEVEKISKTKSEFLSIASHQLRTPLSAIKGYLSMVMEGTYGGIPEKAKRAVENVYKSNERLVKLVNAFLDVTRIEMGALEINFERSSIEDVISEVISEIEIAAKKKNLYLKFEKPEKALPKISIDEEKIKEVILNIIDNAIKYTRKGGITVKCKMQNANLRVEISDTGEGLTKEETSRLFESFSRGTAGARFWTEGVGLGLYVSRKFVEIHGGKIWAESPGKSKGSTFIIELPVK